LPGPSLALFHDFPGASGRTRTGNFTSFFELLCPESYLSFFVGGKARFNRVVLLGETGRREEEQCDAQEEKPQQRTDHCQHFRLIRRIPCSSSINLGQGGVVTGGLLVAGRSLGAAALGGSRTRWGSAVASGSSAFTSGGESSGG